MERLNNPHSKILWITRTAILTAMLVAVQWATAGTKVFAGQYITGSLVNCVLAMSAIFAGLWSGVTVALLSPFCAYLLSVGPTLIQITPCIALGNCVFVVIIWALAKRWNYWKAAAGVVLAAIAKFLALYVAVVIVVIPLMGAQLKPMQVQTLTGMFSFSQLITGLLGGALALMIAPVIRKAIRQQ